MNLCKEKLLMTGKRIRQAYADYRVTVSAVALLTIYVAAESFLYMFDYDVRKELLIWKCFDYSEEISLSVILFICGAWLTENVLSYTQKEKREKIIRLLCLLVAGAIAVWCGLGMAVEESAQVCHLSGSVVSEWAARFARGYAMLLVFGSVYLCHRKSGVGFAEYMLRVLLNGCKATGVFLVLCIGLSLVLTIVETLFIDRAWGVLGETGAILLMGLYYAPCCIMAFRNMDGNIEDALGKRLIKDVLTGMTVCALTVVYVYLIKILLLRQIPSNEIFSIITGLFCFSMPIWMIDRYYKDDTRYMRFLQKLPYGMLPLIPMQIYAIGVRIYEHGMTPSRYLGVLMVVFEIAVLVMWHFYKDNMERMLLLLGVCVSIAFLMPGINKDALSDRWQRAFLENYYQKLLTQNSLTQTEIQRMEGAYQYLKKKPEMAALVAQYDIYEEGFADKLEDAGADMEGYTQLESHQIHCRQMVDSLDVAGYIQVYMLNEDAGYHVAGEKMLPVDFSAFRFYKTQDGMEETVIVDLQDFAKRCMDYEKTHPDAEHQELCDAVKAYNRIPLDDGRMLYIDEFHVRYQEGIKDGEAYFDIESVDISGMLLEEGGSSSDKPVNGKKEAQERREIPIDFPFYGEEEGHRLVLAAPEEGRNAYTLIHYNEDGKILQQIICGKLTEPITFSFDAVVFEWQEDLEIFSADSDTGLLFLWEDDCFSTTPIGIPRYEECRRRSMLTVEEDDEACVKEIYLLNESKSRMEKARSYKLQKDTAELTIWDEIEKQSIYQGTARLDEDGSPLNAEYFDMLLWGDLPLLYDYTKEDIIKTWVGEKHEPPEEGEEIEIDSYEDMQYYLFGNSGHMEQYESREALLADFGFKNSEPMYQYFDRYGNLQLELYIDEDREQMCGIAYINRDNSDLEKVVDMKGFTLCSFTEAEWKGGEPYTFRSVYGTTGEEDENVKDYEENIEYTAFGKPACFVSRGRVEGWSAEDMMQDILRINYTYREDGTLFYRDYYHTHQVFGTTLQGLDSYYDEHERVVYESGYITHGALEYYYFYEDKDGKTADQPAYILKIDYNMDYAVPNLIKCT